MFRLGLRMSLLADFHAFQVSSNRSCWECTGTTGPSQSAPSVPQPTPHAELWNYTADYYQGQTIERLDVAALGPGAPVPPGVSQLPGAGQYYASPALAALLRTVPRDELADRFPGSLAGTIGDAALTGPDELVVYVGYTPARLSAARREERYAAMRLVGATPRQVSVVASVDAAVSGLFGVAVGIGIFALAQPALAGASFIGIRYFADTVTPTAAEYIGLLVAVPVVSAVASLLSLRRVQISPLGVSRKATPPAPSVWRLAPLLAGVALFVAGLAVTTPKSVGAPAYPGLLIILIGLVIAGPWLTVQAAHLFSLLTRDASALLATRRLADNPKGPFRAVRGLVLAVFLGTMVAALAPAINGLAATPNARALSNVLLDTWGGAGGGANVGCQGSTCTGTGAGSAG